MSDDSGSKVTGSAATEQTPMAPSVPRENLISTAVRFLQSPKVTESPLAQRRSFLEKKGLTSVEIDIAIGRAGATDVPVNQSMPAAISPAVYAPVPPPPVPVPVSGWSRFRDYTATAIIVGGLGYGLYIIYKKYIVPMWYGPSQQERHLAAIEKSITELQASINETLKCIKDMQTTVNTQQNTLDDLSSTKDTTRSRTASEENMFVKEVKDEIKSLKGLLLSRKQFPPTPSVQPVLPAWQLAPPRSEETGAETGSDIEVPTTAGANVETTVSEQDTSADILEPLADVSKPLSAVLGPLTDVSEPLPDVMEPSTDVLEPPTDVLEPPTEIIQQTLRDITADDQNDQGLVNGFLTNGHDDPSQTAGSAAETTSHNNGQSLCSTAGDLSATPVQPVLEVSS